MFEEGSFWIRTNYVENKNKPFLAVEAPKHLRYQSLGEVIDWLITSNDAQGQVKKPNELDIVAKIKGYMKTHAKDMKNEKVTYRLQVHLKDEEGAWDKKGSRDRKANLNIGMEPYVLTETKDVDGEDIEIEVLEILFSQLTIIGNGLYQ